MKECLLLDPGDLKSRNIIGPNAGSIFSRSRCPGRRDLLGSERETRLERDSSEVSATSGEPETIGGIYSTCSSSATLRGKGLRPLYVHVYICGAFEDWLAASMSSFSESSWSR